MIRGQAAWQMEFDAVFREGANVTVVPGDQTLDIRDPFVQFVSARPMVVDVVEGLPVVRFYGIEGSVVVVPVSGIEEYDLQVPGRTAWLLKGEVAEEGTWEYLVTDHVPPEALADIQQTMAQETEMFEVTP